MWTQKTRHKKERKEALKIAISIFGTYAKVMCVGKNNICTGRTPIKLQGDFFQVKFIPNHKFLPTPVTSTVSKKKQVTRFYGRSVNRNPLGGGAATVESSEISQQK